MDVVIIIHGGVINSKFSFTFHNISFYNRATFNYRVACCVDFIKESWQSIKTSKEYRKIIVPKIPTNRKTNPENKTANVLSLIFVGFYCSYGDISVKAL